jgi:hypothetical protein
MWGDMKLILRIFFGILSCLIFLIIVAKLSLMAMGF